MSDKLINGAVLRRIEKAEGAGDVKLLEEHLKSNYDKQIHAAVYEALKRMGQTDMTKTPKEA